MSTNTKPLAEWTLGDLKEHCTKEGDCKKPTVCRFFNPEEGGCSISQDTPNLWDLTPKPRFSADEVADMAAVQRIFRSAVVGTLENGKVYTSNRAMSLNEVWNDDDRITYLPGRLFPSLLPGDSIAIADIIGRTET